MSPTELAVGDRGVHQGVVVAKHGATYVEVVAYGGSARGTCDVFAYKLGPRGGVRPVESWTNADKLRHKARRLYQMADEVDAYMATISS